MSKDVNLSDLIAEGLSPQEASMAMEAYYSCRIEGAVKMTAKQLIELVRGKE